MPGGIEADLETLENVPGKFWFAGWRAVNIAIWLHEPSVELVERIDRTNPARTQANPRGLSTVHIIAASARPPGSEARKALEDMHARWGHTVACGAVVIERGGLLGTAMRGAVTGMTIAAPKHYRVKVFDCVDDAAPWTAEQHTRATGVPLEATELFAVLRHARAAAQLK